MHRIDMPRGARYIIEELHKNGYEAYIVGGCVRDSLLNKTPNDWDITTSATPYQVKEIFRRTIDTGIQHGTVTVLVDRKYLGKTGGGGGSDKQEAYAFEVTTYRVDGVYEDHRRPKEVAFTASLKEDLKRRDFTINAMAYNDGEGVIDIFGGVRDLEEHIIRCVGNPADRFDEDALRILRAVRFAAQLGFKIDEPTREAMRAQAEFLRDISAERIQVELTKLITSDNPDRLIEAYRLGITRMVLPEFDAMMETEQNNPHHLYSVGVHTIRVMENVPRDTVLRYTALLHDVGKPGTRAADENGVDHFYGHQEKGAEMARSILRRLKLDNNTIAAVCRLVKNHDFGINNENVKSFRRFLSRLGTENFEDFITIKKADMAGQSSYKLEERRKTVSDMEELYRIIMAENQCLKLSDLAIGGSDLISLGMKPGREMGNMLKQLLDMVLEEPGLNDRDKLTKIVKGKLNK